MNNGVKDLDHPSNMTKFEIMLGKVYPHKHLMDPGQRTFVRSMQLGIENREESRHLTGNPWNPTVKQWNWLHDLVAEYG